MLNKASVVTATVTTTIVDDVIRCVCQCATSAGGRNNARVIRRRIGVMKIDQFSAGCSCSYSWWRQLLVTLQLPCTIVGIRCMVVVAIV